MKMRRVALAAWWISSSAWADTFGGFSSTSAAYLVNQDRVCQPVPAVNAVATGSPACDRAQADAVARLSFEQGTAQRGVSAQFTAKVSGRELTILRGNAVVVTWKNVDPISKALELYANPKGSRVAVVYSTRRLGADAIDVIAFALPTPAAAPLGREELSPAPRSPESPAPAVDPELAVRTERARAAGKSGALAAWQGVLALDPEHSEALFHLARLHLAAKRTADAIAALERLAQSSRSDAVEWRVEARFDAGFSPIRANPRYRAAVGLDRKPTTDYERLMGFGGRWEQVATCGENPHVVFSARRDRAFSVAVSIRCNGQRFDQSYRGTWRLDRARVVLTLPPGTGQVAAQNDEAVCEFVARGDEDALRCALGNDLDFEVLPTRR